MGDLYFWRQLFILTTVILNSISCGIMLSFPSILLPALRTPNITDIEVTTNQVSWIITSNGFAGIFGFFLMPPILQTFGRKAVHIFDGLVLLIGWIIFALAQSVTALIAARIIHGIDMGNIYIQAMIVSEYSDPKRRGYFVTLKKAAIAVGTLMCHALSLIWNWRQIAIFSIILSSLAIVLTLFWPESPSYLAMKGRFKESEKSFVWLHGGSNMQELHLLHSSQLQKTRNPNNEKWYKFLLKKDFVKPFLIVFLLTVILELSGNHYFMVYIIQMMNELVSNKMHAKYFSIGTDFFRVVALMSSSVIISHLKRRTILFSFGVTTVALMMIIYLTIVLKLTTVSWLAPALIALHNFIVNISITCICFTLFGEMFPLDHKGWCSCLNGILLTILYTFTLKLTPILIENTGVGGLYAIYAIGIAICLLVLYYIVPETKDRTLQEIENDFKGDDLSKRDEILPRKLDA